MFLSMQCEVKNLRSVVIHSELFNHQNVPYFQINCSLFLLCNNVIFCIYLASALKCPHLSSDAAGK